MGKWKKQCHCLSKLSFTGKQNSVLDILKVSKTANLKLFRKARGTPLKCLPVTLLGKCRPVSWGRLRETKHWLCPISLTPLTLLELKSPLTFSPLVFESSFSFFLAAVINSLNKASRSFIFSIALNLESLACLAANSLKVVLQQNGKWTHLAELSGLGGRFSRGSISSAAVHARAQLTKTQKANPMVSLQSCSTNEL